MTKTASSVVTIGLTAFALPAVAQDYYAGAILSYGEIELDLFNDMTNDTRALDIFGGARFDVGSNVYVGVELQGTISDGYIVEYNNNGSRTQTFQGEVHLGYTMDWGRVYGFAGFGNTDFSGLGNSDVTMDSSISLGGVGADITISDNLAVRIEVELSNMSVTDNCCGVYDVSTKELSLGAVYNF